MILKKNQSGIAHVGAILLILIVVGAIGFVGWRVMSKDKSSNRQTSSGQSTGAVELSYVEWSMNGDKWQAMSENPPACDDPLTIKSPMDVTKATDVLYPGQIRGGDFKPHGGMGSANAQGNKITVSAVMDGFVYQGSRYIEQGEVQYMFDFIHPCGLRYRLDHLHTLSADLQKIADSLPEAKVDDSRTTKLDKPVLIKEGTELATVVGFPKTGNAFFDLGVYDLRQPNEASKTDIYKTDQQRIQDKEQSFFAVCWFDLLTGSEKTTVKALPARGAEGKTSDYCN